MALPPIVRRRPLHSIIAGVASGTRACRRRSTGPATWPRPAIAAHIIFAAVAGVTGIVESMHADFAGGHLPSAGSTPRKARGIAGLVYRTIRGVTRAAAAGVDLSLQPLGRLVPGQQEGVAEDVGVAVLNGVLGDWLEQTGNPAAIPMALRHHGRALVLDPASLSAQLPSPTGRIVVLVHGLCMSDLLWTRDGASHRMAPMAR